MSPRFDRITAHFAGIACDLSCAVFEPAEPAPAPPTVVAVHGLTRQKRDFDFLAGALCAAGCRVIAFDAPGRGESGRLDPALYHLGTYAGLFADALNTLRLPAVHWIGSSMGGLIALVMAAEGHAASFRSLTLVDVTHKPNAAACARIADYVVENLPVFESVEQYLAILRQNLPLGDVPENVWRHYAEHQLRKTPAGYAFHFDPAIARLAGPALRAPIDLTDGLRQMACPLALVAGGKSDLCTVAEIRDFAAEKPQAQIHICPDAGHVPALADAPTQKFIADVVENAEAAAQA